MQHSQNHGRCHTQRLFVGHSQVAPVRPSPGGSNDPSAPAAPRMSLAGLEACARAVRLCPIHIQPGELRQLFVAATSQHGPDTLPIRQGHAATQPKRRSFTPMRRRSAGPARLAQSSQTPDARYTSATSAGSAGSGGQDRQLRGATRGQWITFPQFQVLLVRLATRFFFKPGEEASAATDDAGLGRPQARAPGEADCVLVLLLHCQHNEA